MAEEFAITRQLLDWRQGREDPRVGNLAPQLAPGVTADAEKTGHLMELGSVILTLALGLGLAARVGANTFFRYFVQWGPSEAARLTYHVYDLELADLPVKHIRDVLGVFQDRTRSIEEQLS